MTKQIFIVLILFTLKPNFTKGQNENQAEKVSFAFKQCKPLFEKLFSLGVSDKDSIKTINNELIAKLETLYLMDTTNPWIGHYLVNCYRTKGDYRKVIQWSKNQIEKSNYIPNLSDYNYFIGCSYISLGELDSSKFFIEKSITLGEKLNVLVPNKLKDLVLGLKEIADSTYTITNNELIENLKLKGLNPCKYSLQIIDFIKPFTERYFDQNLISKIKAETILKYKNCR